MRRSSYDSEWGLEVIRRWNRRRFKVQQRDKAMADLRAALAKDVLPILNRMARIIDRASR